MAQDNKEFTLEDILAEQRAQRELEAAEQAARRDVQQRPARRPISRWSFSESRPSSFMSPSIATLRPGRPERERMEADMELGFAL